MKINLPLIDRNFSHDLPTSRSVATALLPFLALYRPAASSIERLCGVGRFFTAIHSDSKPDIALSATALIGLLFFPKWGAVATSLHDASLNARQTYRAFQEGKRLEMVKELAQCVAAILVVSLHLFKNDRLQLAKFGSQMVAYLVTSAAHFKNGRLIEGIAALIFARLKGSQFYNELSLQRTYSELNDNLFKGNELLDKAIQERDQLLEQIKKHNAVTPDDMMLQQTLKNKLSELNDLIEKWQALANSIEVDPKK